MEFDLNKPFNYWFNEISKIPRPSFHEEKISDFIVEFAKKRGLKYKQDEVFNVIVEKEASPGYEDRAPLLLQAHTDMVPAVAPGAVHDFLRDPLKLYVDEEGWLHAEGTTLGADDGYGVAYMLSILDDDSLAHPYLQCYFTSMEEVGLLGAARLKAEDIKADRMINLDGGGEIYTAISAAGGYEVFAEKELKYVDNALPAYRLLVRGLSGGHSGNLIHLEKGNAIIILGRVLKEMQKNGIDVQLAEIRGGEKDNAIPREAEAVFASLSSYDKIQAQTEKSFSGIYSELEFSDNGVQIALEEAEAEKVIVREISDSLISYLYLMPWGMQHRSMVIEGLTTTSLNPGVIGVKDNAFFLDVLIRSSLPSAAKDLSDRLAALAECLHLNYRIDNGFAAWNYEKESAMRELLRTVLKKHDIDLKEVAAHGGLECGVFKGLNPKLDIITYGPVSDGYHTPQEKLDLASFERAYYILLELLKES